MTARRVSDILNSHVQYWSECVDPFAQDRRGRPIAETRHAHGPPRWAANIGVLLEELRGRLMGRALVRHVRRRTTIYFEPGEPSTRPDELADEGDSTLHGDALLAQARRSGAPAAIYMDPTVARRRTGTNLIRGADVTLAHELAHAVHITHGGYVNLPSDAFTAAYDAPSREEGVAMVLENMYRSEVALDLRATYLGSRPRRLERDPESAEAGVLEGLAVETYRHDVAALATELERLPEDRVPYNPFRRSRRGIAGTPRRSARRTP